MNTDSIWSDNLRISGKPCIRGTRLSMAQVVAEVADGRNLTKIANDFAIDYHVLESAWLDLTRELSKFEINSQFITFNGKKNCIRDHRIPVTMIMLSLLHEDYTAKEEAYDYDLDAEKVEGMLWNLASLLDRDWTNGPPQDIEKAILEGPT